MRWLRYVMALLSLVALGAGASSAAAQDDGTIDRRYRDFGDPGGFLNILPPGQDGVLNAFETLAVQNGQYPPFVTDQLPLYEQLVHEDATPGLSHDQLTTYFKDASFGVAEDDFPADVSECPNTFPVPAEPDEDSTPPACYRPGERGDVVVLRDQTHGVPHIFGDTRAGTLFAGGYTAAQDRLFLMDLLRHLGRAELSQFLGASEANRQMDAEQLAVAPYTEEDLSEQVAAFCGAPDGSIQQRVCEDARNYIAGVNQYILEAQLDPSKLPAEYPALQTVPEEFVEEDLVSIASLVGGIFGKGGGREVANFCGLKDLAAEIGDPQEARAIFDDLHFPNDAEAPTTTDRSFPYMTDLEGLPAAQPDIDCDSLQRLQAPPPSSEDLQGTPEDLAQEIVPDPSEPGRLSGTVDGPLGPIPLSLDLTPSNALLVGPDHTPSGRPIAVFGPQTGYFMPQLLVEKDIHGPGIDARGVAFAGTDLWIQLGRGRDYAWSATSAGGDLVDQWVLELCNVDDGDEDLDGYVHDGSCKALEEHVDRELAKPTAAGLCEAPDPECILVTKYWEVAPDYGFVVQRGQTTDGTPIAIAVQRSTYHRSADHGNELSSAIGFVQINDPNFMTDGYDSFRRAFGQGVDYTFNWFYVDGESIGYQHSCKCPIRHDADDPYMPTWGRGEYDWQGFIAFDAQPHDVNPDKGYITSWNNKQAPGFTANDGQFSYGPVYRSDLLDQRIEAALARGPIDRPQLVDIMELAGTTDLRAQELVPVLEAVMGDAAPSSADPRTQQMWDLLRAWSADDSGHRLDHDADGAYSHPVAIAIMDAWMGGAPDAATSSTDYNPNDSADLVTAVFGQAFELLGVGETDSPMKHLGSAFNGGAESHVDKALRMILSASGADVAAPDDPFHRSYCGGGDLAACRDALWSSLSHVADELERDFGTADVSEWQRVPADDEIRHSPAGVTTVAPIHWVNRPTFQQVVEVGAPLAAPIATDPPAAESGQAATEDPGPTPATGGGLAVVGLLLLASLWGLQGRTGTAPRSAEE